MSAIDTSKRLPKRAVATDPSRRALLGAPYSREPVTTIAALHAAWNQVIAVIYKLDDWSDPRGGEAEEIIRKNEATLAKRAAADESDSLRRAILHQIPTCATDAMILFWHAAGVADFGGNESDSAAAMAARDALGIWLADQCPTHEIDGELGDLLRHARKRVAARTTGEV